MKISDILARSQNQLEKSGVSNSKLDSLILLTHALSVSKEQIIFNPNLELDQNQQQQFFSLVERRSKREPISQIIGKREFFGQDFLVTHDVLDPRPDSESLIELVLKKFPDKNQKLEILEIGTGSGCLITTLLLHYKTAHGTGVDISTEALKICQKNSETHQVSNRLQLKNSDLFSSLYPIYPSMPIYDEEVLSKNHDRKCKLCQVAQRHFPSEFLPKIRSQRSASKGRLGILYHFFGKDCIIDRGLLNRSNLEFALLTEKFSSQKVLFVNQIHGKEVIVVDGLEKIYGDQDLPKADALVTNLPNIVIGIVTADCAPILFCDEEKKIIAATHAGWRGARIGVIAATIAEMKKLGAKNIKAMIGPMIQQKSYEVSQDFLNEFLSEDLNNKSFFVNGVMPEKYLFDLSSYVEKKLRDEGIKKIENLRTDTYENKKDFFSFRRSTHAQETDCGRNVSVIAIN